MMTVLDIATTRAVQTPSTWERLGHAVVWLLTRASTEPSEFGLALVSCVWALATYFDGSLFLTQPAFVLLETYATQRGVAAMAATLTTGSVLALVCHVLEGPRWREWSYALRRATLLGYASFYGGIFVMVFTALPSAPANGYHFFFTGVSVWAFVRVRYSRSA